MKAGYLPMIESPFQGTESPTPALSGERKPTPKNGVAYVRPPKKPECPICKGFGWLYPTDDLGRPTGLFRGADALVRCSICTSDKQQEVLDKLCGLTAEMKKWRLEDMMQLDDTPNMVKARSVAIRTIELRRHFITFYGHVGTGKTYLLASIINAVRLKGFLAVYITMADLLDHLRRAYNPEYGEADYDALWDKLIKASALAIDEIDKFRPTPWAEEKVFQLIDARYRESNEKCTIFATNRQVEAGVQLLPESRYPGYLESRLMDGRGEVIYLDGGDLRPGLRNYTDA
jgi:DNA replication protein DnaC